MRLVLFQPEIAGNAGAAIRAAACFGAGVDIVEPCGFPPDDRALKRAAMDYGALAPPVRHASWAAFQESAERRAGRLVLLTTKAAKTLWEAELRDTDLFLIGQESAGVPGDVRDACDLAVRIPIAEGARSLNAAAAAAIALAEAKRRGDRLRRKPRLIFHIGHPKTATSYLQQAIALNAASLRKMGVNAPTRFRNIGGYDHEALAQMGAVSSGNAQAIFYAFERQDGSVLDAYAPYADGERDLLLSSELFFYAPRFIEIVANYFRGLDYAIELIAYLPRYDRALVTGYIQNVRNFDFRGDISAFVEATRHLRYFRFSEILEDIRTRAGPDRMTVKTFDQRFLKNGDILPDFFDAAGLNLPEDFSLPQNRTNETLPLSAIEIFLRTDPKRSARIRRLLRDWSVTADGESRRIFAHFFDSRVRDLIEREYAADREKLISTWFADDPSIAAFWRETPPAIGGAPTAALELLNSIRAARARRGA